MPLTDLLKEADRQLTICNACRYCEGYCAVFPALELRTEFAKKDVVHIANLCHDCRACYYACMYAPPHEFAVNIPQVLSAVRVETYREYGWPALFSRLFGGGLRGMLIAAGLGILFILALVFTVGEPHRLLEAQTGPGSFYRIVPYLGLVIPFLALSGYVVAVMIASAVNFWRETGGDAVDGRAVLQALRDALGLEYLKGGGDGCTYPDELPSHARRVMHGLVFWGFLADFAATTIAALMQDVLDLMPPYPLLSPPVLLGSGGGIAMIVGSAGLIRMKWRSDDRPASAPMIARDYGFLVSLSIVSITGFLVLLLRETPALGPVLVVHLGSVAGLFLTTPYGKFVHFVYRYAALVRDRIETGRDAPLV